MSEQVLEDWDNLSHDPAAPNSALQIRSRWLRYEAGLLRPDPMIDGETVWLSGGSDGELLTARDYLGPSPTEESNTGLWSTAGFEDVMLVCIADHVHARLPAADRRALALESVVLSERLRTLCEDPVQPRLARG